MRDRTLLLFSSVRFLGLRDVAGFTCRSAADLREQPSGSESSFEQSSFFIFLSPFCNRIYHSNLEWSICRHPLQYACHYAICNIYEWLLSMCIILPEPSVPKGFPQSQIAWSEGINRTFYAVNSQFSFEEKRNRKVRFSAFPDTSSEQIPDQSTGKAEKGLSEWI